MAVIHEGNPGKVDFQELGVFLAVRGVVQHGVDIAQDFFRLVMVAVFLVNEGAEFRGEVFDAVFVFKWIIFLEKSSFWFFIFWEVVEVK